VLEKVAKQDKSAKKILWIYVDIVWAADQKRGATISRNPLKINGAGEEIRTLDIDLGKTELHPLFARPAWSLSCVAGASLSFQPISRKNFFT